MAKGLARRDFVRLCVLGLGAISSASWARCAKRRLRGPAEAGPASLGMQSYSLRNFDVLDAIRRTHELGLRHIEIFPGHLPVDADAERIRAVQAALQAHQMRLSAYGVVRFDKDEAAARRYFEFSKKMGIPALSADPEPTDETMGMLEKLASEYDVKIAIHNHGPRSRYSTVEDVQKVIDNRHPNLGVCVDTGHFLRSGVDPVEAIRVLAPRVHGVHLKDWAGVEGEWPVFGEGKLDLAGVFRALREIGFTGFLSIEYEAHPEEPTEYLRRCIAAIRQAWVKAG